LPPHQGGSAVSFWQLLVAMQRAGHRIRSISPMTPETADEARQFDASMDGIESHRYYLSRSCTDMSKPLDETLVVEQREIPALMDICIAQDAPDVILVGRDTQAFPVAPAARRHGIPWVLRSTGYILRTIEEGLHPKAQADLILGAAHEAESIALQGVHLIPLAQKLGYGCMVIIPNVVDEHRFSPQPRSERMRGMLGIESEAPVVVHASNFKQVKRVIDVIESAPAVLARYPTTVFVIAGDGAGRALLEKRCHDLGITESVRFPGWLSYEDVPELLSLADVVTMPSAFELQAGVYLETQACGRTLLASDIPAAREVVKDGQTGLLFEVANPADLAQKTLLALGDSKLRESIGALAAAEVLKKHSLEHVARQFASTLRAAAEAAKCRVGGRLSNSPTAP
jgi:glycosyltransferase involved in cell wall biosynthesis